MLVKAKVAHTQPVTHAYREEGEEFDYEGKLYKHVEVVKRRTAEVAVQAEPEDMEPAVVSKKPIR